MKLIKIIVLLSLIFIIKQNVYAQYNNCDAYYLDYEQKGCTAYYSPNLMELVAKNRGLPIQDCMIASPIYSVGTWVNITFLNTGNVRTCFVMDIAAEHDKPLIFAKGIVAELDYKTATEECFILQGYHAPFECPSIVNLYVDETSYNEVDQKSNVEFENIFFVNSTTKWIYKYE